MTVGTLWPGQSKEFVLKSTSLSFVAHDIVKSSCRRIRQVINISNTFSLLKTVCWMLFKWLSRSSPEVWKIAYVQYFDNILKIFWGEILRKWGSVLLIIFQSKKCLAWAILKFVLSLSSFDHYCIATWVRLQQLHENSLLQPACDPNLSQPLPFW